MESQSPRQKGIEKRTRGTQMNQFTVKSFPNNDVVRQRGDWRGVASDVC